MKSTLYHGMNKNRGFDSYTAGINDQDKRIDTVLRRLLPRLSLGSIYRLIRKGDVRVNNKPVGPRNRLKAGDTLTIRKHLEDSNLTITTRPPTRFLPILPILWENDDFLIVNKPRGVLVHGKNSLTEQVLQYLEGKLPPSLSFTPGPLHRLDRNTSGILVFGKSLEGARRFSQALAEQTVQKTYLALVTGVLSASCTWEDALVRDHRISKTKKAIFSSNEKGKQAVTVVYPIAANTSFLGGLTLCAIQIHTGRTHQIRAQASFHEHPLLGDTKYQALPWKKGYFLHAWKLNWPGVFSLTAPLPKGFEAVLDSVFKSRDLFFDGISIRSDSEKQ